MTEEELTAREVAERHAEAMLKNYREDGHLVPTLILSGRAITLTLAFNDKASANIQQAIAMTLPMLYSCVDPDAEFIIMLMEAWSHEEPADEDMEQAIEAARERHRHGDLNARAASGEHIDTALLVTVYDTRNFAQSYGLHYNVDKNYRRVVIDGEQQGGVSDVISASVRAARKARPLKPPEYTLARAVAECHGWCDAVLVGTNEDPEDLGFPPEGDQLGGWRREPV